MLEKIGKIFFEWIPIKVSHCDVITSDGEVITSDYEVITCDETLSHVTKLCHVSQNSVTCHKTLSHVIVISTGL